MNPEWERSTPPVVVIAAPRPFGLVYGGLEVQVESTALALEERGISVRRLGNFDRHAFAGSDLLHVFGCDYPVQQTVTLAAKRGFPVVISPVHYPIGLRRYVDAAMCRIPLTNPKLRRVSLRMADRLLPNSGSEAEVLKRVYGVDGSRFSVVPNGVDETDPQTDPFEFRRKHLPSLPPTEPFVLSVARIEPRKNTHALVSACDEVGVPLVLVGAYNPVTADYANRVKNAIAKSRAPILHIPHLRREPAELWGAYAAASAHALVSTMETPGLSSLEAGLYGCNLVVRDSPPVREYFDGIAWFVHREAHAELCNVIREALGAPRDAMSQASHIRSRYTWSAVAAETAGVYERVLS